MALKLIAVLLLTLSTPTLAMDAPVVDQWWGKQYPQLQQKQEIQQKKKAATRCEEKLIYYRGKLLQNPGSSYYSYKLNSWKERCKEDSSANPYIKK